jgi:hypothetical protein
MTVDASPRALVLCDPEEKDPFTVVDSSGHAATFEAARVGAVFHVRTSRTATAPFREYVLCNEAQIERYEVGTETIRAEIEREKELLHTLVLGDHARELWRRAIAFYNERSSHRARSASHSSGSATYTPSDQLKMSAGLSSGR